MYLSTERDSNYQESAGIDPVSLYLKEIGGIPLLTWEEVIDLGRQVKEGHSAQRKLNQKGLSEKGRPKLERQISQGQVAVQELVRHNLRLGVNVAKKYLHRGVPFLDLIQEANLGLYSAAEKFDYAKGYQFSTYATWWIRQRISRCIGDESSLIRLPVHQSDKYRKFWAVKGRLMENLGRKPTYEEWARELGISSEQLEKDLTVYESITVASLDEPVNKEGEDGSELGDFIPDFKAVDPEGEAINADREERIKEILADFPLREWRVIRMRFGIGYDHPYTLEEVGKKFGITRERVRQLEKNGLKILKFPHRRRKLSGLL